MLLRPTLEQGEAGKRIFNDRMKAFEAGHWLKLLKEAEAESIAQRVVHPGDKSEADHAQVNKQAIRKIQEGELSRARLLLDSLGLAPGTPETLQELRDPALRPPVLTAPLPDTTFDFTPGAQINLKSNLLLKALKSAGRGSARDLAGMRCEHLRVLLDEEDTWQMFLPLAEALA